MQNTFEDDIELPPPPFDAHVLQASINEAQNRFRTLCGEILTHPEARDHFNIKAGSEVRVIGQACQLIFNQNGFLAEFASAQTRDEALHYVRKHLEILQTPEAQNALGIAGLLAEGFVNVAHCRLDGPANQELMKALEKIMTADMSADMN
jgi:hypothetical protein